ncbi:MAG: TonB-dependent receptor [Rikenellaceae bacterium]
MKFKTLLSLAFASMATVAIAQSTSTTEATTESSQSKSVDFSIFEEVAEDVSMEDFDMATSLVAYGDLFSNLTSYKFSEMRFSQRGYGSSYADVFLNGVRMNDALTGYSPWSLWSGLNEATRSKETSSGLDSFGYGVGSVTGSTNILARASQVRKGWTMSLANSNGMYRARVMGTYASGMQDNGWAYAFSFSTRQGDNSYVEGVYYNTYGYFGSVEKKIGDHNLAFTILGTPTERGVQSAATQEAYDLTGSNYYNPNVGIQNGEMRNVRVKNYHEPVAMLNYEFKINDRSSLSAVTSLRFGKNGYSALTWSAGQDPRPDYYRYLPSYDACPNPAWVAEYWKNNTDNTRYIDLDRLYNINSIGEENATYGEGHRSSYIIEERHADQLDYNFNTRFAHTFKNSTELTAGINIRRNRTEYYTMVKDLMGGDYWVDVDKFAERDFGSSEEAYQNNLAYYYANGHAQAVKEGDKFSYDYYANVMASQVWGVYDFSHNSLSGSVSAELGYSSMWRDGLWQKGLFPEDSYGKSENVDFLTYKTKLNLDYRVNRMLAFSANLAYINDAPTFQNSFVSPRTRNTITPNLDTEKIFSVDAAVDFKSSFAELRVSGYYTTIKDQSDVISFYNDLLSSYDNYAISGIDKSHIGLEVAATVPIAYGISFNAAASIGEYLYSSTPTFIETADNDSSILSQGTINWDGYHVESTPQTAVNVGLSYRSSNYLFASIDLNYYNDMYISMNPVCRTDDVITSYMMANPSLIYELREQEKFDAAYVVNASVGKSWSINRKYYLGANLEVKNLLNFQNIRTGGYEQMRLSDVTSDGGDVESYTRFDSKYFYMLGTTYFLNVYLRF